MRTGTKPLPITPEEAYETWLTLPGRESSEPRVEMKVLRRVLEKRMRDRIKASGERSPGGRVSAYSYKVPVGLLLRWRAEYQWDRRALDGDMATSTKADAIVAETMAQEIANRRMATRRMVGEALDDLARATARAAHSVAARIEARVKQHDKAISIKELDSLSRVLDKLERINARIPAPVPALTSTTGQDAEGKPLDPVDDWITMIWQGKMTPELMMRQLDQLRRPRHVKKLLEDGEVIDLEAHEITPQRS